MREERSVSSETIDVETQEGVAPVFGRI